ncbi:aminotransferase class I/II-fold pyridoxal phosphate-dependent enzyme [Candidatus Pelagibacter sp.]|nr:aminotransferase class I/II-fold pyridoxal phosphate-dependent enzyme [Candidatus Pelagibacter sp.]
MKNNLLIDHNLNLKSYEKEIINIFKKNLFTKGPNNKIFRNKIKKKFNIKNSVLTSSATTALSLSLEILKIKKGDEVAVSDFSWISSAHVIENIGAKPVFIDVKLDTYNMCPDDLRKKISKKIKAIIFVHTFGNPSGFIEINKIAKKNKIPIIEDAACAIGSKIKSSYVGSNSLLACFSFHQKKILNTGEGGMITTNQKKIFNKILLKTNLGALKLKNKVFNQFIDTGFNYRLSEIQCLIGQKQIDKLKNKILLRNSIFKEYSAELIKFGFIPQNIYRNHLSNIQSCVFLVPEKVNRDKLIFYLKKNNIDSTIGTYSLSNTIYYKNKYKSPQTNSNYLFKNCISLPCHENVDLKKITRIIKFYSEISNKK